MPKYFTIKNKKIVSPSGYAVTGAPMFLNSSKLNINKLTFIYILYLEYGKIYIGKTTNFKARMIQHWSGKGSEVTKKFKPLSCKIINMCNGYFSSDVEQKYTKEYIKKYGYKFVRGGSYTNSKTLVI